MNKIAVYTVKSNKKSEILPPTLFKEKMNANLLSQAIRVYESKNHLHLAKTKTRGEVNASTRKIYRQKGTGFARHGAKSAPIFVGGGIAHGPTGVKRILSLPSKMRRKALGIALSSKLEKGDIIAVDSLKSFNKTKETSDFVRNISNKLKKVYPKITFIVKENPKEYRNLRNIENSKVILFKSMNAYDIFYGGLIIFDEDIFKTEKKEVKKPQKTVKTRKVTKK